VVLVVQRVLEVVLTVVLEELVALVPMPLVVVGLVE
jgi:hypothetical protein